MMTSKTQRHFVWGRGGVGKSHVVLKLAQRQAQQGNVSVLTLDPSLRLLDLMNAVPTDFRTFEVLPLKPEALFEEFDRLAPAQPHLKTFYLQMVKSLQQFREYLQLIQLCRFISSSSAFSVIVDTPPFQESGGLMKSMESLHSFFHQTIVQWALKTSSNPLLQFGMKKMFELTRLFVGKRASQSVFDLLTWLTHHSESFRQATDHLKDLLTSDLSYHHLIVTPETPLDFVSKAMTYLDGAKHVEVIINRSCLEYPFPDHQDSFSREMHLQIELERKLREGISKAFPQVKVSSLSLQLMGDDSVEEMRQFLQS